MRSRIGHVDRHAEERREIVDQELGEHGADLAGVVQVAGVAGVGVEGKLRRDEDGVDVCGVELLGEVERHARRAAGRAHAVGRAHGVHDAVLEAVEEHHQRRLATGIETGRHVHGHVGVTAAGIGRVRELERQHGGERRRGARRRGVARVGGTRVARVAGRAGVGRIAGAVDGRDRGVAVRRGARRGAARRERDGEQTRDAQ